MGRKMTINSSLNIWDFQARLMRQLLAWAVPSLGLGFGLLAFGNHFWQGFGLQAAVWGLVDAGIAWLGRRSARKRQALTVESVRERVETDEARNLRRLLSINVFLDVLYVLFGVWLARGPGLTSVFWLGGGWGILVQGGFLLFFDSLHALRIPQGVVS
jgi:hypothetical protein